MTTTTDKISKVQLWARGLDSEQLFARLLAYAEKPSWGPKDQRVAVAAEVVARTFGDTAPVLRDAPLPTAAELAEANGEAAPDKPAEAPGPAAPAGAKSGDPRADRAARSAQEDTDKLVLAHLRSYPPGRYTATGTITSGIKEILPLVKLKPSLKRLVKSGELLQQGESYQAAIPAAPADAEDAEDGAEDGSE